MDRPQGDALFDSLAKVTEAYGGTTDVARLADALSSLDLGDVPPELAIAVAETLTYVYALDQAVETRDLPASLPLSRATRQLGEVLAHQGAILSGLVHKNVPWRRK